ncbi:MAG: threonine/serine dehydratase [Armatimonadota bacterium]|nr:threonine/serine dehydratase [Armatimonadota bacterium]MDR7401050.1 threonine/serine dehydratase [Armatimonadota bacterium]MDR7403258.1 threonine/serine dehydratase [Armatimonadota bacterium]MDR7436345.1 threonine/serine dehydratase [Armatimonadota bacterium]MDR7471167.1 threonine/serine dehydratase [Armatimonadota bacterium]
MTLPVVLADVEAARARIAPHVRQTPLHPWNGGLALKLENLQVTGSFKVRGAFNHVLARRNECAAGVVTASSGNHGTAVAHVARALGLPAVVVVPEDVAAVKAQAIQAAGAELVRRGRFSRERLALARELAESRGLHEVPPFDDPLVIAGQGTVGLEIVRQYPDVEVVYVPVSGGGLLSGIAVAVKALRPRARVVGVEPAGADRFRRSRAAGRPVALERAETVADGLRVLAPGTLTWQIADSLVDEFVAVSDDRIVAAARRLLEEVKVVAEPSGAASVAAALAEARPRSVAVVSGGNADREFLRGLLAP